MQQAINIAAHYTKQDINQSSARNINTFLHLQIKQDHSDLLTDTVTAQ